MDIANISDIANIAGLGLLIGLPIGLFLFLIVPIWVVFRKAGQPGWASLIPIYNIVVLIRVAKRPVWWALMCFIPCVGFPFYFIAFIDIAKAFGKSTAFGIGLFFLGPIFLPILAFGNARYQH